MPWTRTSSFTFIPAFIGTPGRRRELSAILRAMLGIPNLIGRPIGGAAALLDSLRVLPEIAENTAAMAEATESLPGDRAPARGDRRVGLRAPGDG